MTGIMMSSAHTKNNELSYEIIQINESLLTCQSNTIIDNSLNNFTITKYGNTSVSTLNPFINIINDDGYYSVYFDGSGDGLTVSNLPGPLTGDFTYECWLYPTSATVTYRLIFGLDSYSTTVPFRLYQYGSKFQFWHIGAISNSIESTITINQWYHLAITRSGSSIKFFINGVQIGSALTSSTVYPTSNFRIGLDSSGLYPFVGYISNVRVTGSALYTSNFTVPTQSLTPIPGTSFLTCQSNTIIDNSLNNFTITKYGNTSVSTLNPFINNDGYYSVYFDGSGDYLSIPDNSSFDFGTGNFTIECWLYPTSVLSNGMVIIDTRTTGSNGFVFHTLSTNKLQFANAGLTVLTSNDAITINAWNHIVVVRSGTIVRIYVNGVSSNSTTHSIAVNSTVLRVGSKGWSSSGVGDFAGYISNLRIVKGTAVYTSNFTPSTSPLMSSKNIESSTMIFQVLTTNVSDDTTLYWKINNISTSDNDFKFVTGSVTINNNKGLIYIDIISDNIQEPDEIFYVSLYTDTLMTQKIADGDQITIINL